MDVGGLCAVDQTGVAYALMGVDVGAAVTGDVANVLESAFGGDTNRADARTDLAGIAHTHTGFGGNQKDLAGIHAAQRSDIDAPDGGWGAA